MQQRQLTQSQRAKLLLWCEKLESGEYEQGSSCLRNLNNKYCCLGVAADLIDPNKWKIGEYYHNFDGSDSYLNQHRYHYGITREEETALAIMNDNGKSFKEISQYIRKNIFK